MPDLHLHYICQATSLSSLPVQTQWQRLSRVNVPPAGHSLPSPLAALTPATKWRINNNIDSNSNNDNNNNSNNNNDSLSICLAVISL